jgi:hypothetical protein
MNECEKNGESRMEGRRTGEGIRGQVFVESS